MDAHAERSMRVHLFGCRCRRAWPAVGIVGGGEASTAAQPAMGGRSRRHDRRCFGRLDQEDQRLKKHYGRWMDIVRSLKLESFILTKLTKPLVRSNLVGPQVSLRNGAPQMLGGGIIFWAAEDRISEIEEEARHPLDRHPTATAARTVC